MSHDNQRHRDDGQEVLPDLRLTDVLQQRPVGFNSPWQVLRIAVAVTISWAVGIWISPGSFGIFAPLTTLMVIGSSPWSALGLSAQRILGTAAGVLAASVWINLVGVSWWSVFIALSVSMLIASRLPFSLGGQFQIPIAVLFVFALGAGSLDSDMWRIINVVVGGAIGLIAVYVPPSRPKPEKFAKAMESYREAILAVLALLQRQSGQHPTPLPTGMSHAFVMDSRNLRTVADKARTELVALAESSAFNPRGRRVRVALDDDAIRLRRLSGMGIQIRGITGAANLQYDRAGLPPALTAERFASLLADLQRLGRASLGEEGTPVRTTSSQEVDQLAADLDERLRRIADELAAHRPGDVLESVSLLGRIQYVVRQMRGFGRISIGEDEDDDPLTDALR